MHLLAVGLNHRTAPLELREQVAFPAERIGQALSELRGRLPRLAPESAIVSTCNRTELYIATALPLAQAEPELAQWLSHHHSIGHAELAPHLYALPEANAVRHAFRVASGLDSMVLGEPQILGQLKDAARAAQQVGALGSHLHQLFQRTFAVAKEVRSQTAIGEQSVSMAAAAVRLAQRIFGDLHQTHMLFIGAGEMIELALAHFAAQQPKSITIANRTIERGAELAQRFNAQAVRLSDVPPLLEQHDVIVSCTASSLPIIGLGMVERATRARRHRPIFMVDMAVPRDIEPEVARLDDVFLYTVDDLGKLTQIGIERRQAAVEQAEAIIDTGVQGFMSWMTARRSVPHLQALNQRVQALQTHEIERAQRLLARGEPIERVLESLANGVANKLLHGTRSALSKGKIEPDQADRLLDQWLPSNDHEADK